MKYCWNSSLCTIASYWCHFYNSVNDATQRV